MAVPPIGPEHGIEATRKREKELHPAYSVAWDKRSNTLLQLVDGHNDALKRLAALEARPSTPFPGGS